MEDNIKYSGIKVKSTNTLRYGCLHSANDGKAMQGNAPVGQALYKQFVSDMLHNSIEKRHCNNSRDDSEERNLCAGLMWSM